MKPIIKETAREAAKETPKVRRGQIFWIKEGNAKSCENEMWTNRPAVVINVHENQKLTIVYLTSSELQAHRIRYNVNVLCNHKNAVARCDKITTVDISRIDPEKPMGEVTATELAYIRHEVKNYLQANKDIEKAKEEQADKINPFLQRGHIYKIEPGCGAATGSELSQHPYGMIVSNTYYLDHGCLISSKTLIVSFGISQEEYNQVREKEKYIPVQIPVKSTYQMYYFKTDEYYEVDRSRIVYWDTENYLGRLDEKQTKSLNNDIQEQFSR